MLYWRNALSFLITSTPNGVVSRINWENGDGTRIVTQKYKRIK